MKRVTLILFSILFATSFFAQNLTLKGQIFDKKADKNLCHASVYVEGLELGTFANDEGVFSLEVPAQDEYTVRIEHVGFETLTQTFSKNEIGNLQIQLVSNPIVIEEILVETGKAQRTAHTNIISDPTKNFSQPRDIGDMFKDVPGFGVVKRGGYAMDPVFRSFRNEQLNVQYDGGVQVMHACPNRMDPITTHVIPEEVERIEVIKGPFSVRYGQTMGGVMNIITATPEHSDEFSIGGSVEAGYELNGDSKLTRLNLNTAGNGYDLSLSGGLRDFGSYENGDGVEIPSAFKSYDYAAKAGFEPFGNQRFQIGWRQSFGRDILHAGLPMDTDEDNSSILSVDYVAKNVSPLLYGVTFKGFLSNVDHIMSNTLRPNFPMMDAVATVDATTAGGKLEFSLMPNAKNQLYVGLDMRYLARDGNRVRLIKVNPMTGDPIDPPAEKVDLIWQDAALNNLGVYAENRFFVSDKMTVTAGARLDYVASQINDPAPDFQDYYPEMGDRTEWNVSANLSANYKLVNDWNLEFALGRGTRTANMEERFINHFQLGVDAFEYVGNPDLKAEANHQAELGIGKNENNWGVRFSTFYSYITDYITAAVDPDLKRKYMPAAMPQGAKRFQNIDEATQTGFELEGNVQLVQNLFLYGTAAYTRAENLDWDEPLPEIPPFSSTLGVKFENDILTADLRGRYAAEQDRIAESFAETETPDFTVLDLRAGVRPLEGLSVGAAVLNIFDVNYYEHLNRGFRNAESPGLIYEPGRNVTFYLKYTF